MYHPPQTKNFHFFILLLTLPEALNSPAPDWHGPFRPPKKGKIHDILLTFPQKQSIL